MAETKETKEDLLKVINELREEVRRLSEENERLKKQLANLRSDIISPSGQER